VDNSGEGQLDAAAAGADAAELELEPESLDEVFFSEEDFSEEPAVADSDVLAEPFEEVLFDSRLSVR
jgi:hypothetical protein